MRLRRTLLITLALLLVSSALSAYTIYLKDGSQLIAKKKYEVQNGRAVIVLSTGTQTSIGLEEIDIPRTDAANDVDHGAVVVIPDTTVATIETKQQAPQRRTLAQVIQPGGTPRLERTSNRDASADASSDSGSGRRDLRRVRRVPYRSVDIGNQLLQLLRSRGIEQVNLFEGTENRRILLDVVTNSEAAVFRTLEASARALATLAEQRPGEVDALEILMLTDRSVRAGQFTMTRDRAADLNHSQIDPQQFFLQYVEF